MQRGLRWRFRVLMLVMCNSVVHAQLYGATQSVVQRDGAPGWRYVQGAVATARYQGRDSLRAARAVATLDAVGPLPALDYRSERSGPDDPAGQPGAGRAAGLHVTLTVAPSREVMDSLVGGRVPEWAGAVAISERMEMIVPSGGFWPGSREEEVRVLRHEWAHLALAHELGRLRIPRWFNEGYAEWAAGSWQENGSLKLGLALAFGDTPPLDSLALTWPRDRVSAEVAYLLSASVIHYLVESSGVAGLEAFIAEWKRGRSFDNAMRVVYGATPGQLETDWRGWVKRRYGWMVVISHSSVFWTALVAALAAMFLVRRRYRREQMARLRAGEPPDAPEYWSDG